MLLSFFKTWDRRILASWMAPPVCELCSRLVDAVPGLCPSCLKRLHFLPVSRCELCALPFAAESAESHRCGDCLERTPAFDKAYAAFLFRGAAGEMLRLGKFGRREGVYALLADLSQACFARVVADFRPDGLCPVPLSWLRCWRRGFNQSALLAAHLRKRSGTGLPIYGRIRRRHGVSQSRRNRGERRASLKGAFALRNPGAFEGKRILLIDDVMTTGATAQALSRRLKQAGAAAVAIFAVARVEKF